MYVCRIFGREEPPVFAELVDGSRPKIDSRCITEKGEVDEERDPEPAGLRWRCKRIRGSWVPGKTSFGPPDKGVAVEPRVPCGDNDNGSPRFCSRADGNFVKNPQYCVRVKRPTTVFFSLLQAELKDAVGGCSVAGPHHDHAAVRRATSQAIRIARRRSSS